VASIYDLVDRRLRLRPHPKGVDRDLYLYYRIGGVLERRFQAWKEARPNAVNFPYGQQSMRNISQGLRSRGIDYGERILWAMLQLYRTFEGEDLPVGIGWAAMRSMLRIRDPVKIRKFARKASRNHMTTRRIQEEVAGRRKGR